MPLAALLLAQGGSQALAAAPGAAAGLVETHAISSALAIEIAQNAVATCAAKGFAVSASIADAAGEIRTTVSADAVSALSVETARRKARTAALVGDPTSAIEKAVAASPPYAAMLMAIHPDFLFHGGGLPVRYGGAVIGAIGVGGAPGSDADEACARAALAAAAGGMK